MAVELRELLSDDLVRPQDGRIDRYQSMSKKLEDLSVARPWKLPLLQILYNLCILLLNCN